MRLGAVVLEGTFGRVYRGTYTEEEGVEEDVLVKTVTGREQRNCSEPLKTNGNYMYRLGFIL